SLAPAEATVVTVVPSRGETTGMVPSASSTKRPSTNRPVGTATSAACTNQVSWSSSSAIGPPPRAVPSRHRRPPRAALQHFGCAALSRGRGPDLDDPAVRKYVWLQTISPEG